ncbi:MAG: amidophosphoribosyltransferase [Elusimicrobiota bacterium]
MCGIVGIADHKDASQLAYLGLFALQHRGQEAAGIIMSHRGRLAGRIALGLVAEAFPEAALRSLKGRTAVGHVRYATAGGGGLRNAQPLVFATRHGQISVSHNGTLTNALSLRRRLERDGAIFRSTTDSEVVVHLIARRQGTVEQAIAESLRLLEGAYSFIFQTPDKLIAARDPLGFRPLCLGRIGRAYVFASETTALNHMGARLVREIEPGEIVIVEGRKLRSLRILAPRRASAFCVFEQIYFARPDSTVFGRSVHATRRALGRELAREMWGLEADIVVPVPDSGVTAALGFAGESGVPLELGFVRSHYVGRSFIQPAQILRDSAVSLKLAPVREILKGKRIVLVDDSLVRGTTSQRICRTLREVGAKSIHVAVSSPPIISPCYYGIDTPSENELLSANNTLEQTRRFLHADSIHFLSIEGMLRAANAPCRRRIFCTACFTGRYPTRITDFRIGESARCIALRNGRAAAQPPDPAVRA